MGGALPASVRKFTLTAPKLSLTMDGTLGRDGTGSVIGAGRSADYGAFSVDARMAHDGPHAQIVLDSPLPAAGIRDVRLGITPIPQGIGITVEGLSRLGTFNGSMGLFSGHGQPTRLQIQFLRVWQTDVTGGLELGAQGISGDLGLHGGGIDGTVHLAPQDGAQAVKALLLARNAKFGGDKPIAIGNAKLDVDGLFGQGNSTLNANLAAQGSPWARSSWAAWRPAPRWSTDRAASPPRSPGGVARSSRFRAPPPIRTTGSSPMSRATMPGARSTCRAVWCWSAILPAWASWRAAGTSNPRKSPSGAAS
jgi:hypothetical protein